MRLRHASWLALGALAASLSCQQILGIDEGILADSNSAATSASGGAGSGGSGSGAGGGSVGGGSGNCMAVTSPGSYLNHLSVTAANDDGPTALARRGNEYLLAGSYLGELTLGTATLPDPGSPQAFAAIVDQTLNVQRAIHIGGAGNQTITDVATDGDAYYIVGYFDTEILFNSSNPLAANNSTEVDGFIAKLTPSLDVEWVRHFDTDTGAVQPNAVAVDINGAIWVGGSFSGTMSVGGRLVGTASGSDVMVARFGPDGTTFEPIHVQGAGISQLTDMAAQSDGGVVMVGYFGQQITFDIPHTTVNDAIWVARHDGGDWAASRKYGGTDGNDTGHAITVVDNDDVAIAVRTTSNNTDFGGAMHERGLIVFRLANDLAGNVLWSYFHFKGLLFPVGLVTGAEGNVVLTGYTGPGIFDLGGGDLDPGAGDAAFVLGLNGLTGEYRHSSLVVGDTSARAHAVAGGCTTVIALQVESSLKSELQQPGNVNNTMLEETNSADIALIELER